METRLRPARLILAFVLLAALLVERAWSEEPARPAWSPKATAEYLEGRADWWLNWSDAARGRGTVCASCHTALPFALARPALSGHLGESTAGAIENRLIDNLKQRVESWEEISSEASSDKEGLRSFYPSMKPASLGTESVLNALILVNNDVNYGDKRGAGGLTTLTKKALRHLWEQQQEDGAWLWLGFGLNPWEKDGAFYGASLAAVALGMAGKDYYEAAEVQKPVAALSKYLNTQSPEQPLHHRATQLWASSWIPDVVTATDKQQIIDELLNTQEADGGWSLPKLGKKGSGTAIWESHGVYPEGAHSDGYATGLVVLALRRAGVAKDNPKLQKGIGWLTSNQQQGTWPVNYINIQRNPETNVGKFMRDAAAGFATLALSQR